MITSYDYLCGFVSGGGDEIGSIGSPLQIGHSHVVFMDRNTID